MANSPYPDDGTNFTSSSDGRQVYVPGGPNAPQVSGPSYTYDNEYKNDVGFQNRNSYGGVVGGGDFAVNRYRDMGAQAQGRTAYVPDFAQSNEARGYEADALGLARDAAYGNAPSRAEILGRRVNEGAIAGTMSTAASIKGGPGARVAAMRHAQDVAAAQEAAGNRDIAAMRADEMARARGDYFGAASGMRGQDLGAAGMQQQSELFQRGLNDQAQQHYEDLGNRVNEDQLNANQNAQASANGQFATNQGIRQGDEGLSWQKVKTVAGAGASTAGSVAGSLSDVRAKEDIYPVSVYREPETGQDFTPATSTPWLDQYMAERGHDVPYKTHDSRSAERGHDAKRESSRYAAGPHFGARPGYAASREGQPGYMFGPAPEATYTPLESGPTSGVAPGTDDWNRYGAPAANAPEYNWAPSGATSPSFLSSFGAGLRSTGNAAMISDENAKTPLSQGGLSKYDLAFINGNVGAPMQEENDLIARSIRQPGAMMSPGAAYMPSDVRAKYIVSDARAKREAFAAGAEYAVAQQQGGSPELPDYASQVRELPQPRGAETTGAKYMVKYQPQTAPAMSRSQPWRSDEDPMAEANRSYEPSAYHYKPGFGEDPNRPNVGPMAQNMAADPIASTAIVRDPQTGLLAIDQKNATKLALGGLASTQKQLDEQQAEIERIRAMRTKGQSAEYVPRSARGR